MISQEEDMNPETSELVTSVQKDKIKKLPYFHRELSDIEKAIIGDIAPKKIDRFDEQQRPEEDRKLSVPSSWNNAGTWEEKDRSLWCSERIKSLLTGHSYTQDKYECIITKTETSGHGSITCVRGKPRFLFEFELTLTVDVFKTDEDMNLFSANVILTDVENDQLDDIESTIEWPTSTKAPTGENLNEIRRVLLDKTYKKDLIGKLKCFELEFRQL